MLGNNLEVLPVDDPLAALDLLRMAACDHVVSCSPKIQRRSYEWRDWIAADIEDKYPYPLAIDIGRVASRCAGMLDRYTELGGHDRSLPRSFIYTVGALLVTDVQGFKELSVLRPDKVGAFQPEDAYWALLDIHRDKPQVTPPVVKHCLYSRPDDPGKGVLDYLDRLHHCYEALIPELRVSFGYTGPLPDTVVRKLCLAAPVNYAYKIKRWFTQSYRISEGLGHEPPRLTMATASGRCVHTIDDRILRSRSEIDAGMSVDLKSHAMQQLTQLRRMYSTGEIRFGANPYAVVSAKILRLAIESVVKNKESYSPQDAKWAAGFVDYSIRHYNRLHPDGPIPTGIQLQTALGLAYLADVQYLRKQGVYNPHAVARYHDSEVYSRLCETYDTLPGFIIRNALQKQVTQPDKWLDDFIITRQAVLDYVLDHWGFDLEIELANFIAVSKPADMHDYIDNFWSRYQRLISEWDGDNDVESWMLRRAALMSSGDPARRIGYLRFLAQKGFFRSSLDAPIKDATATGYHVTPSSAANPLDVYIEKEEKEPSPLPPSVVGLLAKLSEAERAAVMYEFGITLPDTPMYNKTELEERLGVNDVGLYIIDRLRRLGHGISESAAPA